jgi:NADPH:quinone reductase-like Zn-dependent oxidoreductase
MEQMKAVTQEQYGGPDVLKVKEVAKPSPKENELLISVYAAPITAAGGFMREGVPYMGRLVLGLLKPKKNIFGVCFSGEIEAVGSNVTKFKVGDKVFGETLFNQGTYAEYVCVGEDELVVIKPENMTHAEAAPLCDGHVTSMNFLTKVTTLKAGQSILIIGASGSLGTAAVQIARSIGAQVTGVCSSNNVELVKRLGAQTVIDYTQTDFTKGNLKYDVIYDTVGKSSFSRCKPILAEHGVYMSPVLNFKLLCYGAWTSKFGKKKARFSATGLLPKEELRGMLAKVKTLIIAEKLVTIIDRKYSLNEVSEAHAYVDTGRKRGNVILNISDVHHSEKIE